MTLDMLFDAISPHGEAQILIERGPDLSWRAAVYVATDSGDTSRYEATGYSARVALMNLEIIVLSKTPMDISDWQEVSE